LPPLTKEIDEAFKSAAIYGLYQIKSSNSQASISFPLLSSTLVSSHLNPFLPEGFEHYNFKKTSWKKAATFLKKWLEKEGVVKTKDRGGDTVVLSINWEHKLITGFHPYDLATKQSDKAPKQPTQETPALIKVQELYKPSGKTLKLLLESLSKKFYSD
jgi:translation initiation factor 2D